MKREELREHCERQIQQFERMDKFPTYEEMAKKVAEKALDEYLYNGKSIREWMQIITSEDAVSRQAVEEMIKAEMPERGMWEIEGDKEKETVCEVCVDLMQKLSELSPVTPQQKIGHWIHREDMDYLDKNKIMHEHFMCQDCGFIHDFIDGHASQYKYCPFCGEKMQEVEE